jgi:hypothetical protein
MVSFFNNWEWFLYDTHYSPKHVLIQICLRYQTILYVVTAREGMRDTKLATRSRLYWDCKYACLGPAFPAILLPNHTISSHSISNRHWGHISTHLVEVLTLNQPGETGRGGTGHITLPFISDISKHRNFEYIARSSCPLCTSPMRLGDEGRDI